MSLIVISVVIIGLMSDFTNGFRDTANAMATSIAKGALRRKVAVVLAGILKLVGAFLSVASYRAGVARHSALGYSACSHWRYL
jgi:inorganic phosphate transporter, PiT family